jgi:SAM-dependent methyltransferase
LTLDPLAATGFARAATIYERGRPGYPDEAIARAWEGLGLDGSAEVLDLGAGTGKLTRALLARAARVIAVEPLPEMRAALAAALPEVAAVDGTAEQLPLEDGAVDAVWVGEAFHWFANERSLAEIARVLRPGGGLAMLWNVPQAGERGDVLSPKMWKEISAAVDMSLVPRNHPAAGGNWRDAFTADSPFGPLEEAHVEHELHLDAAGLAAFVGSISFVAILDDGPRAELLTRIEDLATRHFAETGTRTASMPYRCDVFWTRRGQAEP